MQSLVAIAFCLFAFAARAESINFMYGSFKYIQRTSVSHDGESMYSLWNIDVIPEFGLVQFKDNVSGKELKQIYFTPMISYQMGKFTIDGGIGISLLNGQHLGEKNISTNFQFTDHIGIGYTFYKKYKIGYRITHVSNADIKRPNPGIDSQQVYFSLFY